MHDAVVVEEHQVALAPVVRVDEVGVDGAALQLIHELAHLGQVLEHGAVGQVQPPHRRRVHHDGQPAADRVAPRHGVHAHLGVLGRRQLVLGQLEAVGEEAQAVGPRLGLAHPDVRVRRVLDPCAAHKRLLVLGQQVVQAVAAEKGRRAEGHVHLHVGAVVVQQRLPPAAGHRHGEQGRHQRGVQVVHGRVNVPAVKVGKVGVLFGGYGVLVEGLVVGVLELDVLEALKGLDMAVANDLDLWLVGNGLQVGVQDAALVNGFSMTVNVCFGIKSPRQTVLCLWCELLLVADDYNLVLVKSVT